MILDQRGQADTEERAASVRDFLQENPLEIGAASVASFTSTFSFAQEFVCMERLQNGWYICRATPTTALYRGVSQVMLAGMAFILLIIVLSLFLSRIVSRTIAKPLQKLVQLMERAQEGDFSARMNVRYNDEVGALGNQFNLMLEQIDQLIQNKQRDQAALQRAQFSILQEQINPHFLYNTLESVNFFAYANEMENVVLMISALTCLLRIALNKGDAFLTVRQETEYIKNYLTIQAMRYQNKLTYEVDIAESMMDYITPKLILQPIVENAIYHGVKYRRTGGHVHVTGREIDDHLEFQIRDTGLGLTEKQAADLSRLLKQPPHIAWDAYTGFGLRNVSHRIKLIYGVEYGLSIESMYGEGTAVTIRIPKTDPRINGLPDSRKEEG